MLIFYALFGMLMVISGVCIYNIIVVIIYQAGQKISIVRSIGGTRRKIIHIFMQCVTSYPVIAGVVSAVLVAAYMWMVEQTDQIRNALEPTEMTEGAWYLSGVWMDITGYHPYVLVLCAVGGMLLGIGGITIFLLVQFVPERYTSGGHLKGGKECY